jgi:lipoprotein-releasing system permease protein
MGATDRSVLRIFMLNGLYIGIIGVGLGLAFGLTMCFYLKLKGISLDPDVYYIARLPVAMREGEITVIAVASLLLSFLATLYPAYTASRLRPVEGLRYE